MRSSFISKSTMSRPKQLSQDHQGVESFTYLARASPIKNKPAINAVERTQIAFNSHPDLPGLLFPFKQLSEC